MPRPPRTVADSGRSGRGRRLDERLRAAAGGAAAPPSAPTTPLAIVSCTSWIGLPAGTKRNDAGRDVALHRADALGEAAELVEAEAHERAGLVVCLPDQLCHGSMYLHIG